VDPGQRVAVVGSSGAGKTTILNLLLRFWEYEQGQIWLGEQELRKYRADDVRQTMSVVSQHSHLFAGTVRQNLRMARPDASETELIEALRRARLLSFVQSLPKELDTWIGEQGVLLSGGERQRLVIARAILQDNPILLLDEVTANLDPITERKLLADLKTLMRDRTSLIATHRLVGLEDVDNILVLQRGRIVEQGRHHDLLQADTIYHRMWELQRQNLDPTQAGESA
jgi:ATP-binding cassette subfamily C protein CydC